MFEDPLVDCCDVDFEECADIKESLQLSSVEKRKGIGCNEQDEDDVTGSSRASSGGSSDQFQSEELGIHPEELYISNVEMNRDSQAASIVKENDTSNQLMKNVDAKRDYSRIVTNSNRKQDSAEGEIKTEDKEQNETDSDNISKTEDMVVNSCTNVVPDRAVAIFQLNKSSIESKKSQRSCHQHVDTVNFNFPEEGVINLVLSKAEKNNLRCQNSNIIYSKLSSGEYQDSVTSEILDNKTKPSGVTLIQNILPSFTFQITPRTKIVHVALCGPSSGINNIQVANPLHSIISDNHLEEDVDNDLEYQLPNLAEESSFIPVQMDRNCQRQISYIKKSKHIYSSSPTMVFDESESHCYKYNKK